MKDAIFKSWRTTLVGIVILAYLAYKLFWLENEIDTQTIIEMLFATGFIVTKDAKSTHTKP